MASTILQVGVKILLQDEAGRYLLLRRSARKYPEAGASWDLPGGRILPGTPLLDNLRREVAEETGLEISGCPRLVAAQDILRLPERHVVRLTYVGTARGEVRLDEEENDLYRWLSRAEIEAQAELDAYLAELVRDGAIFADL